MNVRAFRCTSVPYMIRLASTAPKYTKRQKQGPDGGWRKREGEVAKKTWTKNRWEVRRNRFMYDMLGLIKKGKVDDANDVFGRMKSKGIRPDTAVFNTLISAHGKKRELRKAFKLFNDLKKRQLVPSHHTYSSLFGACAAVGGREGAEVLSKLQAEIDKRNFLLNGVSYNALLTALVKCDRVEQSFEAFSSMSQMGIAPTIETFSILLLAASKDSVEGIDKALRIWTEMIALEIVPDSKCYGSLLLCLRTSGASSLLLEECSHTTTAPAINPNKGTEAVSEASDESLKLVADCFMTIQLTSEFSLKVFFTSEKEQRWIENDGLDVFLKYLKSELVRVDIRLFHLLVPLIPDTEYLLKTMKTFRVSPDDHCILAFIRYRLSLGDQTGARLLMKRFKVDNEQEQKAYQAIASTCYTVKEVTQLLEEMKEQGVRPNSFIFVTMISNAIKHCQYDCLTALIKEMKLLEFQPTNDILRRLDLAAANTHKNAWVQRKQNGFKGSYSLWKRMIE